MALPTLWRSPFPSGTEGLLSPKDQLLRRKITSLLKTQRGPHKPTLKERGHVGGMNLDNVTGVSTNGSNLRIQRGMGP